MNIEDTALKHAREYLTFKLGGRKGLDVEEIICDDEIYTEIVNELADQFKALLAELGKGAVPACFQYQDREGNWKPFIDEHHQRLTIESGAWNIRKLFTHPANTAEIEQRTAEACAKMIDGMPAEWQHEEQEQDKCAEAIRSGKWREYK